MSVGVGTHNKNMKMHSENQINISNDTISCFLNMYGIYDFSFKPIDQGIENTSLFINCEGKKYVLRIYRRKRKTNEDICLEIEFQDYLREHGIPIPFIYPNLKEEKLSIINLNDQYWQAVLMEFIEGESVNLNPNKELIAELANIQAKMHLLGIEFANKKDKPESIVDNLNGSIANKIENLPIPNDDVAQFVERVKSFKYEFNKDLPYGYNHLDLDFDGNVIIKDGKIAGIIDFDDLRYSPSVMCLGFSLWNILDDSGIEAFKIYLKEYESIRSLSDLERQAILSVMLLRNYEVGIIRLMLWKEDTSIRDITDIIELEKYIPSILKNI